MYKWSVGLREAQIGVPYARSIVDCYTPDTLLKPGIDHPFFSKQLLANPSSACWDLLSNTIYLGVLAWSPSIILHECAHAVDIRLGISIHGDFGAHDPIFLDKWCELMIDYGLFQPAELRDSLSSYGLSFEGVTR